MTDEIDPQALLRLDGQGRAHRQAAEDDLQDAAGGRARTVPGRDSDLGVGERRERAKARALGLSGIGNRQRKASDCAVPRRSDSRVCLVECCFSLCDESMSEIQIRGISARICLESVETGLGFTEETPSLLNLKQ